MHDKWRTSLLFTWAQEVKQNKIMAFLFTNDPLWKWLCMRVCVYYSVITHNFQYLLITKIFDRDSLLDMRVQNITRKLTIHSVTIFMSRSFWSKSHMTLKKIIICKVDSFMMMLHVCMCTYAALHTGVLTTGYEQTYSHLNACHPDAFR